MPSKTVNAQGVKLYYEDSGAPPGSTSYSTVFLIHGYFCYTPVFRPAFVHARSHNLRLIAINMREYPGSSPLSEAELARFTSNDLEDQTSALVDQAVDIARLIVQIIKAEDIPLPQQTQDAKSGGVSVLAWGVGAFWLTALLANLDSLDEDVYACFEKYITTAIIYSSPTIALGMPDPETAILPIQDITLSSQEVHKVYMKWTSTYWQPFSDFRSITPSDIDERKAMPDISPDPKYESTEDRRSQREIEEYTFHPAMERLGPGFVNWQILSRHTRCALFDTKGACKNIKVVVLWPDMSPWTCIYSAKVLSEMLEEPQSEGEQRREVDIVCLEDANHYLHLDDPERFVCVLARHV